MPTPTTATAPDKTETDETSRLLTSEQVARFFGCTPRHIFNLRQRGMPAYRIGKIVRFDIGQVRRWLEGSGNGRDTERGRQLSAIAAGDDDNAECAASDLHKEFPGAPA
jgi:hypothetical protein